MPTFLLAILKSFSALLDSSDKGDSGSSNKTNLT